MGFAPGLEIIQTSFLDRPLNLVLVKGREAVLIDTGLVGTASTAVLPALSAEGMTPADLSLVIITHGHADHYGGNEELQAAAGGCLRFAAHRCDRAWIEEPEKQTWETYGRYIALGLMSEDGLRGSVAAGGHGVPLAQVLEGGEVFDLGDGHALEVVYAPGHSSGNLCVLDRGSRTLIQGETITGVAQYDIRGNLLTVPYYEDPVIYLRTLAAVARLEFDTLVPSHLPVMDRAAAQGLLAESASFVPRFEAEVIERLRRTGEVSLLGLLGSLDGLWGAYPADLGMCMLLESHLKSLLARGVVTGSLESRLAWAGRERHDLEQLAEEASAAIRAMV